MADFGLPRALPSPDRVRFISAGIFFAASVLYCAGFGLSISLGF
jgi:hypothetical protein